MGHVAERQVTASSVVSVSGPYTKSAERGRPTLVYVPALINLMVSVDVKHPVDLFLYTYYAGSHRETVTASMCSMCFWSVH